MKPALDRKDALFLTALLLAVLPAYAWTLNDPFVHHGDMNGPLFGTVASNLLKHGVYPLGTGGPSLDDYGDYRRHLYINHPPLQGLVTALAFAVGGESDRAYRVCTLLHALASVVLFLCLGRSLFERPVAWIATALLAATPLYVYFMGVVGVWTTMFPWAFAMMIAYREWIVTRRPRWWIAMIAAQILCCASDWEGYYAAVVVAAHSLWTRRDWKRALLVVAVNVAAFGCFLAWLHALSPTDHSLAADFLALGSGRTSGAPRWSDVAAIARHVGRNVTVALTLAAIAGLGSLWSRRRSESGAFVVCWLGFGLHHVLFFRYAAFHEYLTMPVLPFFAWAAALAAVDLWRRRPLGPVLAVILGLGFIAQSVLLLRSLLTHAGGPDSVRYEICMQVREHTSPDDRVLIVSRPPLWHYTYYAGRYFELYAPEDTAISRSLAMKAEGHISYDRLIEMIRSGERRYDWVVVPRVDLMVTENPRFAGNPELARWWHALEPDSEEYRALEALGTSTESHRGFVFIRLR